MVTDRRERQWFERYRWFVTSDGRLALGGRDSTSNSIVVNKYVTKNDVVFHADLHGSPFFVLRNRAQQSAPPSDDIALEMSQATVGFSRAWKDELGSADVYWVYPDQIKKGAPTGEYLPRGSFFIEGKKNFVRHVKVELSVGIMSSSELPESDGIGPRGIKRKSEIGRCPVSIGCLRARKVDCKLLLFNRSNCPRKGEGELFRQTAETATCQQNKRTR